MTENISAKKETAEIINNPILKLYLNKKLGNGMTAIRRLQAAVRFCEDYRRSFFKPRLTTVYDSMPRAKSNVRRTDAFLNGQNAAERYFKALKAVKKYEIYALHFLRDEQNAHQFILKYPVLCGDSVPTYRTIYRTLCALLDKLADFYEKEEKKSSFGNGSL